MPASQTVPQIDMQAEHLIACQFGRWYPASQHVTCRSRILDLPKAVVDYLLQDGVYLPASSQAVRCKLVKQRDFHLSTSPVVEMLAQRIASPPQL